MEQEGAQMSLVRAASEPDLEQRAHPDATPLGTAKVSVSAANTIAEASGVGAASHQASKGTSERDQRKGPATTNEHTSTTVQR